MKLEPGLYLDGRLLENFWCWWHDQSQSPLSEHPGQAHGWQTLSRRTCSGKVWTVIRSACWQLLQSSPPDQEDLILNLLTTDTGNFLLDQGTVVAFMKEGLPYKGFLFNPCNINFSRETVALIQSVQVHSKMNLPWLGCPGDSTNQVRLYS